MLAFAFPAVLAIGVYWLSRPNTTLPSSKAKATRPLVQANQVTQASLASSNTGSSTQPLLKSAVGETVPVKVQSASNPPALPEIASKEAPGQPVAAIKTAENTNTNITKPPLQTVASQQTKVVPGPEATAVERASEQHELTMGPGGELMLHVSKGSISVLTGAENKVSVQVVAQNKAEAQAASERLKLVREGNRVRVRAGSDVGSTVCYQVFIPHKFNLDLKTQQGDITITNLESNIKVFSASGRITIGKINGTVTAESPGGVVALQSATGPVKLETADGRLLLGQSSQETALQSTGGSIEVLLARGPVRAKSITGPIKVAAAFKSVNAESAGGLIDVSFHEQPQAECVLRTQSANIQTRFASKLGLDIHARSDSGKVISDALIKLTKVENSTLYRATYNGGGRKMVLKTASGNIHAQALTEVRLPFIDTDFELLKTAKPKAGLRR